MMILLALVRLIPYSIAIFISVHRGYKYLPIGVTILASLALISAFSPLPQELRVTFASFAALFIMLHALELKRRK